MSSDCFDEWLHRLECDAPMNWGNAVRNPPLVSRAILVALVFSLPGIIGGALVGGVLGDCDPYIVLGGVAGALAGAFLEILY